MICRDLDYRNRYVAVYDCLILSRSCQTGKTFGRLIFEASATNSIKFKFGKVLPLVCQLAVVSAGFSVYV